MLKKIFKNKKKVTRSERLEAKRERDKRRQRQKLDEKRQFMIRVDNWGYELAKDL